MFVCAVAVYAPLRAAPRARVVRAADINVRMCAGWGQGDDGKLILFVFVMELVPAFSHPPSTRTQRAARRCVLPRVPRPACRRVPPIVREGVRVSVIACVHTRDSAPCFHACLHSLAQQSTWYGNLWRVLLSPYARS